MKISRFIARLNKIKRETGDVEVVLSCDSEGNRFGSTDDWSFGWEVDGIKHVLIYPNYEGDTPEECVEWEEKHNPRTHKLSSSFVTKEQIGETK